ncbi:hypothetical protein [Alistipes sp.]|uniref:hypothetical protein n=1 Tax=Alistipes sp. TaxID=1872444 RepID=UPI003AEFF564
MLNKAARYALVALSLAGSAILLYSCAEPEAEESPAALETLQTEYSENLSIVESLNGRRSYHFETPLLEGYTLAREPYREFRKGIKITTYQDDSLSTVDAVLTANYAINYEKRKLWEAKGNVVVVKSDGKTLYTQQLFWNALTKKIYSNVDSKIVQNDGRDVFIGEGFESDEEFKDWRFRRMKGRMEVNVTPTEGSDSVAGARPAAAGASGAARKPETPAPKRAAPARPPQSALPVGTPPANAALDDAALLAVPDVQRPAVPMRSDALPEETVRRAVPAQSVRDEQPALKTDRAVAEPARGTGQKDGAVTKPDRKAGPKSDAVAKPAREAVQMDRTVAEPAREVRRDALRPEESLAEPRGAVRSDEASK